MLRSGSGYSSSSAPRNQRPTSGASIPVRPMAGDTVSTLRTGGGAATIVTGIETFSPGRIGIPVTRTGT